MFYYVLDSSDYVISKHKTAAKQIDTFLKVAQKQKGSQMVDSPKNIKKGEWLNEK